MISVELKGRLGNHLFQYATCRVIAEKNGFDFSIPDGGINNTYSVSDGWLGKILFDCPLGKNYIKQNNVFKEGKNKYNEKILSIEDGTHLDGYWQSEKYFDGWEENIREWYSIDTPNSPYINEEYCVIHFRAQDNYLSDNYTPNHNFFKKAKDEILKYNNGIQFVVITDNEKLAKEVFKGDIVVRNDVKTDFSIITHSKYKIISNSSFSWWAAWLGSPKSECIIAPKRWMNYNYNKFNEDIFYPYDIKSKEFIYI